MIDRGEGYTQLLEANNDLPLLWVALLARADVQAGLSGCGPTLRLVDGPAHGVTVAVASGIAQLMRRRALIAHWIGSEAATVLDQFAEFLNERGATTIHLDLAEWVDAAGSVDQTVEELLRTLDALDGPSPKPGAKRRPPAIKSLMDGYGLSGLASDAPAFGNKLAGFSETEREPWRRDPPRERRRADDPLRWSYRDLIVSADGQVVIATIENFDHVGTPLYWRRGADHWQPMPIDDAIGHLWAESASGDGSILFGACRLHPGEINTTFRWDQGSLQLLPRDGYYSVCAHRCNRDGSVAVGFRTPSKDYSHNHAVRWSQEQGAIALVPGDVNSQATHLSDDGSVVAGIYQQNSPQAGSRAFIWTVTDGFVDINAAALSVSWIALSPDGQRGVLEVITARGGPREYRYWRRDAPLLRIEDEQGRPLARLRVSTGGDAAIGYVEAEDGERLIKLWRPGEPVHTLTLPPVDGNYSPLYVTDGGKDCIVTVEHKEWRYDMQVLVASEGQPIRNWSMAIDDGQTVCSLSNINRASLLRDVVAVGRRRLDRRPVMWTAATGLVVLPAYPG